MSDTKNMDMGMDLEQFRQMRGMTCRQLQAFVGHTGAERVAIGKVWPSSVMLVAILDKCGGLVTVDAMWRRRQDYLRKRGKLSS